MAQDKLSQLKELTTIVIDTGDIDAIKQYTPIDATTNPSLLFNAAQKPQYKHLVEDAIKYGRKMDGDAKQQANHIIDKLAVNFGSEILKIIPGRVSTEVDARLSFDKEATIKKALKLLALYQEQGIGRERILIKIASTWEGIEAAKELSKEGVNVNMTLIFSLIQSIGAALAGVTIISPFVGRILDWYKKNENKEGYPAAEDPGVKSVTQIYNYFKKMGFKTSVMGASFRNTDEILELAGCDLLTIAPQLMKELQEAQGPVERKLDAQKAKQNTIQEISYNEKTFRWLMNEDAMATEKLAEGIRNFTKDTIKLEKFIETVV